MLRNFARLPSEVIDDRVDRLDVVARQQADWNAHRQGEERDEAEVELALTQPPDAGPAEHHRSEWRQCRPIHVQRAFNPFRRPVFVCRRGNLH
jgi:hypothetical protein